MPIGEEKTEKVYLDLGNEKQIPFDALKTVSEIDSDNKKELDICPAVVWSDDPCIEIKINMKRRDHRRFLKMIHSWGMHDMRMIRSYKRFLEKVRRAKLKQLLKPVKNKYFHLVPISDPHQEHSL